MANRKKGKLQFCRTICRMEEINLLKQLVELLSSKYQIVARIQESEIRLIDCDSELLYTHTHARAKSIQALVRAVRGNNHMQIM